MPEQENEQIGEAPAAVPELFSGAFSIDEALSQLRLRLLDLTARNRLLNFKPSVAKTLQVVDTVPNAVYDRLLDGKTSTFWPIPDPAHGEYVIRDSRRVKPDVREYAKQIGVNTSYELPVRQQRALAQGGEGGRLRALYYPEELERQCRRIAREAQSAIEETGTNMLYLVIGFLEFYESDDSDRALNAPLVAIPVSLKRSSIDPDTRVYRYDLTYTGEEISENLSLREKLKQDLGMVMPEMKEDETPDDYFERVRDIIRRKPRWKVKRQMTLALLSFAKMMLVQDIDPKNWPQQRGGSELTEHSIVRQVFEGGGDGVDGTPADYLVDDHKENGIELIYDADTSQHSALIDALSGKNLVVNGPPGTGKSQTITNLIAAAIARGKKVLFVSEKLAALEVVKHRLEQAGLGDFCLELHSHKTDKKRVVDALAKRKNQHYAVPRTLANSLEILEQRRKKLKRYADLVNSKIGNELDLTVFELLWRAERHRQSGGPQTACLESVVLEDAPHTHYAQLDEMQRTVAELARHYGDIGSYGSKHPWYGFFPESLNPGDDLAVQQRLVSFIEDTKRLDAAIKTLRETAQENIPIDIAQIESFAQAVDTLKEPGPHVVPKLLPKLFTSSDMSGITSKNIIDTLKALSDETLTLQQTWEGKLVNPNAVTDDTLNAVRDEIQLFRDWKLAGRTLEELENNAKLLRAAALGMQGTLAFFVESASIAGFRFDGTDSSIRRLHEITGIAHAAPEELLAFRHAALNQPLAKEALAEARKHRANIEQQRQALDGLFWLDEEPAAEELRAGIQVLRQGDTWYRFLQGDWRRACRFHKRLLRDKKAKKSGEDRLRELTVLSEHLRSLKGFRESKENSETFGRLFQGTDTDFEKVERLVAWYEDAREALLRANLSPAEFDPTTFDAFRLSKLAMRFGSEQAHYKVMAEAGEDIKQLLPDTEACRTARTADEPWTVRLESLTSFLDDLEAGIVKCKGLSHISLTPVELLHAVDARRAYVRVLEKIRNSTTAQQLLGEYFAGVDTDFTSLLDTFTWGQQVIRADLPEGTTRTLLVPGAATRLAELKQAADSARDAAGFIERFAEDVKQFGAFDWNKWKTVVQPGAGDDPTEAMRQRAVLAIDNLDGLLPWTQYSATRASVQNLGLMPFAERLEAGEIASDSLQDAFLYRFHGSIAQSVFRANPELGRFSTTSHEQTRTQFAAFDREVIALRGSACAADAAKIANPPVGISSGRVDERTEMELLRHLATLQRPRTPIRQMIRRAGRAIQELMPCFMMGPLSVAQYLEPGAVRFDLIVMDEASQLKPEEALGAIARGRQFIVVGDAKQLPPTSFFDKMMMAEDEEDEGTALTTSESILDICMPLFTNRTLRWHYRSKHESLIAFSNHHFYNGELIVFPSPYPKNKLLGLRYHAVRNGVYQNRQNIPEAMRVVDAVLEHMRERPDESLGVVTLNITQRDLIEEILEKRLKDYEEGETYRAKWANEGWPFFVKNLENVQGDERDVIFISTTFGRPPGANVVRQNFGPISRPTGWRRLNVLFTRARKSLHVYSSMQPEEIVIDGKTPEGTKALRNYLEYASRGVLIGADITEREPDSDFEVAVADVLRNKGYSVQPQLGVAGFFIDLVVRNPDRPGEYMAAIECDGASYHSGVSVRDRDRIRQEILEGLGWKGKIWRIWSADWFRNPASEIPRLLGFLEARRKTAAAEPVVYGEEPQVRVDESVSPAAERIQLELGIQPVDEDEELFVEVGDTVTYCDVKQLEERLQVLITDGPSNFDQGIVNEATPLAKTLLDSRSGEVVHLALPGKDPRAFKVLKIERDGKAAEDTAAPRDSQIPEIPVFVQQRQPEQTEQPELALESDAAPQSELLPHVIKFCRSKKLRLADNRSRQGALWVYYPFPEGVAANQLMSWGFKFAEGKGWWLK